MSESTETRQKWRHRAGDTYMPVFGDWFGNPSDGYEHLWSRLGVITPHETRMAAQREGFREQGSDDFNIAVIRGNRVVACLWMTEDMAEEQHVLDQLTKLICDA